MIPDRTDPRWREFVTGKRKYELQNLAARMLLTRLRLRTMHGDAASLEEAVNAACDYFERNEATTSADVIAIFGGAS